MLINHTKEKRTNAIIYFRREASADDRLKLYQLLYQLDFRHYAQTGRSVTGLEYFAWPEGPVPAALEEEIGALLEKPTAEFDAGVFTKREMGLMREIVAEFAGEIIGSARLPGDPWERVFVEQGGERRKIPFEYSLAGTDADDEVKAAAEEHREMIANYS
jgi:antitoxin SocA-like protein